ncbi:hypothetical protein [Parafrankia sp. EUN1f]|uniref:hypothetical protein n=1 Tax=Parafrankia sp. EUN1f TaxID=102897 RepID=UPI0001C4535D|nr:hypothetical protein [Parafrankia sp. EUN1f]EFC78900.1 hypothetical protein FrEUN1fDRAFT_7982 [Parafrankia sp. EUN1f]
MDTTEITRAPATTVNAEGAWKPTHAATIDRLQALLDAARWEIAEVAGSEEDDRDTMLTTLRDLITEASTAMVTTAGCRF